MARRGDSRSPSPAGSYSSRHNRRGHDTHHRTSRDDGRLKSRRSRSRSPGRDVSPRQRPRFTPQSDLAKRRDRERGRDYRDDRRRDDYRGSRRDRSRDRRPSPGRLDKRERSRERGYERRDRSRDHGQDRRRRDDSADGRPRSRHARDDGPGDRASDYKSRDSSKPSTPLKQSEEDKQNAKLAKLEAWKAKKAAERERNKNELQAKGGPLSVLEEMDRKANGSSIGSPGHSTPPTPASPAPYAGKFDPKAIARKVASDSKSTSALGEDVAVPSNLSKPALSNGAVTTGSNPNPTSLASKAPQQNIAQPLKAKGNLSGFGLGNKTQNESDQGPSKRALDFGEEEDTRRKFEKLPTPPPQDLGSTDDAAQANGTTEDQDDEDQELTMDGGEEAEAAAARAAAEKREERIAAQSQEASAGGEAMNVDAKDEGQDAVMADAPTAATEEEDDIDPLDAFMTGLEDPSNASKAPGLGTATSRKARQQEPQALFSDDEDELTTIKNNPDELLDIGSKSRKKKDIPTVDHAKANYETFRKNFYTEPSELAELTEEEVISLRAELDGIKVRGVDVPKPVKKWSYFGLGLPSLNAINALGFEEPTAIQSQAIPAIMSGRDVIGVAKTGSGKTIAFLLPMFRHIKDQRPVEGMDGPVGLIMTPTRELATQIHKECRPWLKALNLRAVCAYGGAPITEQIAQLKKGAEIIVCTPGRMIDLLAANSGRVTNLRRITYTVLDEADRMFDMGFEPQVMKILNNIRPERQLVLFSATFPKSMEALARKTLKKPVEIIVGGRSVVAKEIEQVVEVRPEETKFRRLLQLLGEIHEEDDVRSLVFVERQEAAEELMSAIMKRGYPCMSIHGGKEQYDRDSVISDFKAGIFPVLVATSVAARGLDVKQLKLVVNYDCPNHLEDYVHRAGRTGRAGNTGKAVTFITEDQGRYAPDLAKALKQSEQDVPEPLEKLVETFLEKVKAGKEKASSSGFGGKGIDEIDRRHDAQKKRERGLVNLGDDVEEEEEKPVSKEEQKLNEIVVKPAAAANEQTEQAEQAAAAIDERFTVKKTEQAPATQQDRMKGVTSAVAAINARLRKSGDIRGNAPIDNKGPDAGAFHSTFEINDLPQKARWAVTNRTNVAKILEATGTSITSKGNYYPAGKDPSPTDPPKLYILVEGDTEVVVTNAMRELIRLAKDGAAAAADSEARAPASGRYSVV